MAIKITLDSFLAVIKRSGLLSDEQLTSSLEKFRAAKGAITDAKPFAEFLVRQKSLTVWQAEKVLQGKHKGFFLGRYRLLSLLGKGGMSSVYLAEHTVMKRHCALKVLPAKRVNDASYLGRFHREAQAVAALDHPNIVRAYDVDMTADAGVDIHFLAMEFVQGKSLLEVVQEQGPVSVADAAEYVRQSAHGLDHAHQAGLVHRDVKPGNLLVTPSGVIKVLDLGLARFFDDEDASLTVQHDEKVLGTADYISPEQAIDSHKVDRRTDIYSLGCTLYFLLSGHPPFNSGSLAQRLIAHQTKLAPSITADRSDVPAALQAIMEKMMAKKLVNRYQTAQAVADAIALWQKQSTVAPAKLTPAPPSNPAKPLAPVSVAPVPKLKPQPTSSQTAAPRPPMMPPTGSGVGSAVKLSGSVLRTPGDSVMDSSDVDAADPLGSFLAGLSSQHDIDIPVARTPAVIDTLASRSSSKALAQAAVDTATLSDSPTEAVVHTPPAEDAGPELPLWEQVFDPSLLDLESLEVENTTSSDALFDLTPAVSPPVASSRPTNPARPALLVKLLWLVVGGCCLVVLVLFGWYRWGRESNLPTIAPRSTPSKALPAADLAVIDVGPQGHFTTINQAITFVRENFRPLGSQEARTIRVAGGFTYPESIHIVSGGRTHFPRNVTIKAVGPSVAVIQGDGTHPVIDVQEVESLTLEGFLIDAQGADLAVRVAGYSPSGRLISLQVQDFKQTGVLLSDVAAQTGEEFQVLGLSIQANAPTATGIRCQSESGGNTVCVQLTNLRIRGPLKTGIETSGTFWKSRIADSGITQCQVGVRFSGGLLDEVSLINNTFSQNERGMVFTKLPEPDSKNVKVLHTLFSGNIVSDATLETGDATGLASLILAPVDGRRYNRTDRKEAEPQALDLFSGDGQRNAATTFMSNTPTDPLFLKPNSPELIIAAPAAGAQGYVGAVSP